MPTPTHRRLIRQLSWRYTALAVLLILLAIGEHLILSGALRSSKDHAATINLAGRQRLLAQRILFLVEGFQHPGSPQDQDPSLGLIRTGLQEFSRVHQHLVEQAKASPQGSPLKPHYLAPGTTTGDTSVAFIRQVEDWLVREPHTGVLPQVGEAEQGTLIGTLDQGVQLFEAQAQNDLQRFQRLLLGATFGLVGLVVLGTVAIIRPAIRRLKADQVDMEAVEQDLRLSRSRFQAFTESASDWYWETDAEHRLVWIEASPTTVLPFDPQACRGRTRREITSGEEDFTDGKWVQHQADLDARRPFREFEYRILDRDGHSHWISSSGQPYFSPEGAFLGYRGTGKDIHAHKDAVATLHRLSQAVEQCPVSIIITDAQARIDYVNPCCLDSTGYTREELLGANPRVLQSGIMPPTFYQDMWNRLLAGHVWHGDICNKKKSGELYWEEASISPIRDDRGHFTHYVAVKRDITAQWREEQRSHLQRAILESIVQRNAPEHVASDLAALVETLHPGVRCSLHSTREHQAMWHPLHVVHLPDVYATWLLSDGGPIAQVHATRERRVIDHLEGALPDELWAQVNEAGFSSCWMEPIRTPDGEVLAVLGLHASTLEVLDQALEATLQQTTFLMEVYLERVLSEAALKSSEAALRGVLKGALDGIITMDDQGLVLGFNHSAEAIFGYKESEVLGHRVSEIIIPPRFREAHDSALRRHREEGLGRMVGRRIELPAVHADGHEFPIELSLIRSPEMGMYAAFTRDLTSERQAQEKLRRSQKMQALGELAGGIAHDFNNMLAVVMGNIEMAQIMLGTDRPEGKLMVNTLAGVRRGADLTRRLLMFARKEEILGENRPTSLNAMVKGMEDMLQRTLTRKIEVVMNLQPDLDPVLINPHEFEDCILNLCINARDAMPQGGVLTLSTEHRELGATAHDVDLDLPSGRYVVLSVSDSGTGIPPSVMERIFDPFFTTKAPGKGTGLGLSMIYGTVKRAGGTIKVYSEVGRGTTFHLFLPPTQVSPEAPGDTAPGELPTGTETLLVVDDNAQLLRVTSQHLEAMGYHVIPALSGTEALQRLKAPPPVDLVVCDVIMPGGVDGIAIARDLLARTPPIPILLTSGYSGYDPEQLEDPALRAALKHLLRKPFSRHELAEAVRQALTRHS